MDHQRQVLRMGAAAILFAIFLRLLGGGFFNTVLQVTQSPTAMSFLVYLQTGRAVRYSPSRRCWAFR